MDKTSKITVICFHRISDEYSPAYPTIPVRVFERLIKYFNEKYNIISIYEIEKVTETTKERIILTFDDAFTDFKENVLPVLIKYNLPSVLNAITTCLDTGETLWTQKLNKVIEWYFFNKKSIKHNFFENNDIILTSKNVEKVSIEMYLRLLKLDSKEREKIVDEIAAKYNVNIEQSMLRWDDLKYCMDNKVVIGNHTINHMNLTTLSLDELHDEINLSTKRFEDMLGVKPNILAFPNGQYNKEVLRECKSNGYKFLLTTKKNSFYIDPKDNSFPLIISRISLYSNPVWKNILSFYYHSNNPQLLKSYSFEIQNHQNCYLCNSYSVRPLKGFQQNNLVKCKSCNFVFSSKIPSEEEIIKHYEGYGRDDFLSPVTVKRYNELLDVLERYRKTNKIFDVGCGIGYFLEEAKKRGWEVYGNEITDKAIEICQQKGIKMYKGKLPDINLEENSFDVITSFEVIEHINNPAEEVGTIYRLLRKGGVFYFTTPNFNAVERYLLKEKYNIIYYPEHLSYYTPKTINFLMSKFSFKRLFLKTTGFSLTRFKNKEKLPPHIQIITPTAEDERIRNRIEKNPLLKLMIKLINAILNLFKIGNSIKGLYQK